MESEKEASVGLKPSARPDPDDMGDEQYRAAQKALESYLLENSEVFQRLNDIQEKGWHAAEGDEFFRQQREKSDHADERTQRYFFNMMRAIGREMHETAGAFHVGPPHDAQPRILDLCVAPGGFLAAALLVHPRGQAVGFTLPESSGGHRLRLLTLNRVNMTYVDITMLAADLGLDADDIPPDHPDRDQFILERLLPAPLSSDASETEGKAEGNAEDKAEDKTADKTAEDGFFDLAFCDGQVLRTHERAAYRTQREGHRLTAAQLALALGRLRPGGTLVVRLHRAHAWGTAQVLRTAGRIADRVRLFKPQSAHAKRSSFYLVALGVRSRDAEARAAVRRWERVWRVATLGSDDEYVDVLREGAPEVEGFLAEFGERLIELATPAWEIQAQALAKAPFMKEE